MSDAKPITQRKDDQIPAARGWSLVGSWRSVKNARVRLNQRKRGKIPSFIVGWGASIRMPFYVREKGTTNALTCLLFHVVVLVGSVAFILGVAEFQDSLVWMRVGPW